VAPISPQDPSAKVRAPRNKGCICATSLVSTLSLDDGDLDNFSKRNNREKTGYRLAPSSPEGVVLKTNILLSFLRKSANYIRLN
jgi:hypothetical protein